MTGDWPAASSMSERSSTTSSMTVTSPSWVSSMMSSMTNTFELGRLVIRRRMSRAGAATNWTCLPVSEATSSARNRLEGSATATVSTSRTRNSGTTRLASMYSRGSSSAHCRSHSRASSRAKGMPNSWARHSVICSSVQKPCETRISPSSRPRCSGCFCNRRAFSSCSGAR